MSIRRGSPRRLALFTVLLAGCAASPTSVAAEPAATDPAAARIVRPPQVLLDPGASDAMQRLKPSSDQVAIAPSAVPAAPGLVVTVQPGKKRYPGVNLKPEGADRWDLSAFGHVEARVVNVGATKLSLTLRIDNAGDWRDSPWNTEAIDLKPGASGTVTTIFGYSDGHKPGYAIKPAAVVNVALFAKKPDAAQSFRIESIVAAGSAGEGPPGARHSGSAKSKGAHGSVSAKPKDGVLLGPGVAVDAQKQIEAKGATATVLAADGRPSLRIVFAASQGEPAVKFKPAGGRWDLRDCLEIRVKVRGAGQTPVTPRVCVESDGGQSDWVATAAPLASGATEEITVPFAAAATWRGIANGGDKKTWRGQPGTGNRVTNDTIAAVTISALRPADGAALVVESIRAGLSPAAVCPEWLGRRPPVSGDWIKTFDDEFDGDAIDLSKWNIKGPNYWDKTSHWSARNVIVGDGVARLRYEKKSGPHNDDPSQKQSDYASGYLDTYGKWVQRYGYFEARIKPPAAPGLWPGFWMMPDRGERAGPQKIRQDTGNGGMEFDILEHLTRWGPCRYNIAAHWDGYRENHKRTGSDKVYVQPDKEGFITAGLLWTPGLLVYYGNGREVARWENPRVSNVPSDLMFTLPTGGWDNNRLNDARLPADFLIDYVRVWQRKDLATGP